MKKSLILFVHGIDGSSTTTWGAFPALIRADGGLVAKYDVALDDYPTRKTGRLFERIGGLNAAAEGLKTRLTNKHGDYDDIAIIAHSQGGLIVLRYMLDRLLRTEPMPLTRLLTYSTPYAGATGGSIGAFLGVGSEQAKDLAPESDFLFRLNRDWGLFRDQHRVMMKAVIAGCDGVVGAGSAAVLGVPFEWVASGNHQTIVKPDSARHESFLIAKRFLLGAPARPRTSPPLKHAVKLLDETRTALHRAWEKLDERLRQNSNSWLEKWDGARSHFEAAFAKAAETGLAECWQAVIEAGSDLREEIRANVEDEFDLPVHYTAFTAYTDKVQKALKAAGATPGNALPPEHDELVARIEKLEQQTGDERVGLEAGTQAPDVSAARQRQIEELFKRLDEVEKELEQSKMKAIQVEQINIVNVDPASILALIRDALEALKHGVDLLDDKRFSEPLRRGAKATWLTGRRYVRAVQQRFAAFKLPWRQEAVFEDFERREPRFDLPLDNDAPSPSLPPVFDVMEGDDTAPRYTRRVAGDGMPFRDRWTHDGKQVEGPELVIVPPGAFVMGSPPDEAERYKDEGPRHLVTIAEPFAVGRYTVTFDEWDFAQDDKNWREITRLEPRKADDRGWGRGNRPVIDVNWEDAQAYVRWLREKTGREYRLLTEAEWEYVARAGTTTPFWWGLSITPSQANYNGTHVYEGGGEKGDYREKTVPVDQFQANPFGLYQVHGNVWEWVEDAWYDAYDGAPSDGSARTIGDGDRRVLRGGSWGSSPGYLRAAFRYSIPIDRASSIGFRLARTLNP